MTLRTGAVIAQRIATEIRDLAALTEGPEQDQRRHAAKLRALAYELEVRARKMAVDGVRLDEPEP